MNLENFAKLRDGLRGELQVGFDMSTFFESRISGSPTTYERRFSPEDLIGSRYFQSNQKPCCGTVACALGHSALLVAPPLPGEYDWADYLERVYGVTEASAPYNWVFGYAWAKIDNTPEGAAARIDWMLTYGVPEDGYHQMKGMARLCYKVQP